MWVFRWVGVHLCTIIWIPKLAICWNTFLLHLQRCMHHDLQQPVTKPLPYLFLGRARQVLGGVHQWVVSNNFYFHHFSPRNLRKIPILTISFKGVGSTTQLEKTNAVVNPWHLNFFKPATYQLEHARNGWQCILGICDILGVAPVPGFQWPPELFHFFVRVFYKFLFATVTGRGATPKWHYYPLTHIWKCVVLVTGVPETHLCKFDSAKRPNHDFSQQCSIECWQILISMQMHCTRLIRSVWQTCMFFGQPWLKWKTSTCYMLLLLVR